MVTTPSQLQKIDPYLNLLAYIPDLEYLQFLKLTTSIKKYIPMIKKDYKQSANHIFGQAIC